MKHIFTLLIIITNPFLNAQDYSKNIDSLMNASFKTGVFNGNILVHKGGNLIYSNSFGYADNQKSNLTINHSMPIGSIIKEFSAVSIMVLSEQGKLNINDPLGNYLDFLPSYCQAIKIKHLLNYSSGIISTEGFDITSLKKSLSESTELKFTPGTQYDYNYSNIILRRALIEKISGHQFKVFLKNELLKPLGIDQISQPSNSELHGRMAESFDNDGNTTTFIHDYTKAYYLTADNLHKWLNGLYSGKLINKASLITLGKAFSNNKQSALGNIEIDSAGVLQHYHHGSGNNYEAIIYYSREIELEIILMTNNQNFKLGEIGNAIINIVQNQPFEIPKRSIYLDIREKLNQDFESGIAYYLKIKSDMQDVYDMDNEVNDLKKTAQYLIRREKYTQAISILSIGFITCSISDDQKSAYYELLGDCYTSLGKTESAKIYFKKCLELDTGNRNAQSKLNELI
ncbi:serine hydrolase [Mangrovivirga cuniculi]|uniref:Beta-lactamase-related domain-containing protein n=1 Tax=Mangrovivirga cuniculi TaxID=2715131 RepID=A0A4D7JJK5_9BACT|nr:serine hydrolase [Mangrovivirga cuniculi]QCK15781.1 hypothetical protein DCC35_14015 [Mangrovivirga cuniculi]